MLGNWDLEWLNINSQRRYPLTDEATAVDQTGTFALPDDFLVEADIPISAGISVTPGNFFIHHIGAYATGYSIIFAYNSQSGPIDVAAALIPRIIFKRNTVFALAGIAPFDDTVGKVVIGNLGNIDLQPGGFFTFNPGATLLEPDTIRPILRGLSAIRVSNGEQLGPPLYGDIQLVAGTNIQLSTIQAPGQDPVIRISAVSGAGLNADCNCGADATPPIASINGIRPTITGDFTILGDNCLQVVPIAGGIRLVDTCSAPCCGCPELEAITRDLEQLNIQSQSVEGFVSKLQTAVDTLDQIVLGSKLNDAGCLAAE